MYKVPINPKNIKRPFNLNEKYFLIFLFILSLSLKLIYGYFFENKFRPIKCYFSPHETMATNFMKGKGLTYNLQITDNLSVKRHYEDELVYPLICGIVYLMTKHNLLIMLLLQMFYTSFIPIFIYFIAKQIFDVKVARLAGFLSALVPGIIVYSAGKVHSMTFYSLIFCISLCSVLRFIKEQNINNTLFMGFMLGVGILSRNNFIFFVPFSFLFLFLIKKINVIGMVKIALIISIVLLPLIARNYYIYKTFVLFKNPPFWPVLSLNINDYKEGEPLHSYIHKKVFSGYKQITDLEYTKIMNNEIYSHLKKNKAEFVILAIKRFYCFWWFSGQTGKEYPKYYLIFYKPYYSLTLFFAIFGIIILLLRSIKNGFLKDNQWLLLIIFIFSITIPHYLFYVEGRHRFAIEPLLLIFTSYGLLNFYNSLVKYIKNIIFLKNVYRK